MCQFFRDHPVCTYESVTLFVTASYIRKNKRYTLTTGLLLVGDKRLLTNLFKNGHRCYENVISHPASPEILNSAGAVGIVYRLYTSDTFYFSSFTVQYLFTCYVSISLQTSYRSGAFNLFARA